MCCFYRLNQALHKNFEALAILQGRDTDNFWALKVHLSRCSAYLFAGHLAPPFHLFPCTIHPYALGVSIRMSRNMPFILRQGPCLHRQCRLLFYFPTDLFTSGFGLQRAVSHPPQTFL